MKKKNGYITFSILALGTAVSLLALSAASLSVYYVRSARQYKEAIQLSYMSESALLLSWQELRSRRWQDVPARKTWVLDDQWDITGNEHHLEIQCISTPYGIPFNGILRASAVSDSTLMKRTCALKFSVQSGDDGIPYFAIRQLTY